MRLEGGEEAALPPSLGISEQLHGWSRIASYLGIPERAARHKAKKHGLPTFKLGATVCANRSSIDNWSREMERSQNEQ